jgi:hypothetical protein
MYLKNINTYLNRRKKYRTKDTWLIKIARLLSRPISTFSALLVGIAIGIAPIWYNNYLNEPKLFGRVITTITGNCGSTLASPNNPNQIHAVFLVIANKRNIPVPIVDYSLKYYFNNNQINICNPNYSKADTFKFSFNKFNIYIPTDHYLLYKTDILITPDKPLSGYVIFNDYYISHINDKPTKIELILLDGFGNKHIIKINDKNNRPPELLPLFIKGMKIVPS